MTTKKTLGIVGARGHTGAELIRLVDAHPGLELAFVSSRELAKELFTHKGSGTLVRRGEKVQRATAWEQLDLPALKTLIESSFGRELLPDYFERTPPHAARLLERVSAPSACKKLRREIFVLSIQQVFITKPPSKMQRDLSVLILLRNYGNFTGKL